MRKVLGILLAFFIVVLLLCGAGAGLIFYLDSPAPDSPEGPAPFTISEGEPLVSVARRLEAGKLVRSSRFLVALSKLRRSETLFQRGSYLVPPGKTTRGIHDFLIAGSQLLVRVTIPEGWTLSRTAGLFEEKKICSRESFLAAAQNRGTLDSLGIPADSALGYLFPDTYFFPEDFPADRIIAEMAGNFRRKMSEIDPEYEKLRPGELHEQVTLASIVEREYRDPAEAPLMASVFYNRLGIKMALGSCATVEYIITEIQKKPHPEFLTYRDIEIPSPYNTYQHIGLPPGPICNPGKTALEAVFFPAKTDYWYFVLKDPAAGTHFFSRNLQEHNSAKVVYLKKVS
ncbi:MAG: endolytic transglycosylase MltG [Spirochaetales bacterium]|jgi:UPF0755 protein|nr:endolytic transglycosylase MltG [Spirochaetales bacterium]